jgi:catechol 2,3-dioxygenase-like lactoylglutathione lyase family enzyme
VTDDIIRGADRREFLTRAGLAGLGATAVGGLLAERATAAGKAPAGKGKPPYDLPGEASLGGNISKSVWYTINVSDLDRAVEFYEATYPVKRAEEMNGPAQAFPSLGISRGQFKARLMRDSQPFQGGGILLVQWLDPKPVGVPYPEANHVGWYREHANASQTGQTFRYQQALAAGGRPYGEPSAIAIRDDLTIFSFAFRDPDGTTLEWVGPLDPTPNGPPDTVAGPNVNCRDMQRSYKFYAGVLGFDLQIRLNPSQPQPGTNGSLGDLVRTPSGEVWTGLTDFDAAILVPRGDSRNSVDLLEWQIPGAYGSPYKEANHLGAVNLAWEVNSVAVVYEKLRRLLKSPKKYLPGPPETWDLGDFGTRKVLNIKDPDGVMLQFVEKVYSTDPTPIEQP